MFEDVVGTSGARFLIAAAAVAAGLGLLALVLWFMRNRASSPFVRGGKNRQPRLAVLDAAAVDTRRRLVLVRRDDVEHLIMIGGPTDIVIESRIVGARPVAEAPSPAPAAAASLPAPAAALPRPEAAPARAPLERRAEARPAPRLEPGAEPRPDARPEHITQQRPEQRPEQRSEAKIETRAAARPAVPPVSAMGQALYGEDASPVRAPPPRPSPAPQARSVAASDPARPSPVATGRTPEDILDAARSRVLSPSPSPSSAPGAAPVPAPTPALAPAPALSPARADPAPRDDAREFERLLDAQISGDLGRLGQATPSAPRAPAIEPPRVRGSNEPSLEEEMNRMLNEMGTERKS